SGAMWFIVVWQLAQMTDEVSRKSMRPVVLSGTLSNGQGEVYWPLPLGMGAVENSVGNLRHTNDSCTHRTRRMARLPYQAALTPGSGGTRTGLGAPFPQAAGAKPPVAGSRVGQVPEVAVNRSVSGRSCTTSMAAKVAAVSRPGPPVRKLLR